MHGALPLPTHLISLLAPAVHPSWHAWLHADMQALERGKEALKMELRSMEEALSAAKVCSWVQGMGGRGTRGRVEGRLCTRQAHGHLPPPTPLAQDNVAKEVAERQRLQAAYDREAAGRQQAKQEADAARVAAREAQAKAEAAAEDAAALRVRLGASEKEVRGEGIGHVSYIYVYGEGIESAVLVQQQL